MLTHQLQLQFDPDLADQFPSLLALMAQRVHMQRGGADQVAPKLDLSPSNLGEILGGGGSRKRKFGLTELERYIERYRDVTPILYLIAKYMPDQTAAHNAAVARIADIVQNLPELLAQAGVAKQAAPKGRGR